MSLADPGPTSLTVIARDTRKGVAPASMTITKNVKPWMIPARSRGKPRDRQGSRVVAQRFIMIEAHEDRNTTACHLLQWMAQGIGG